MASNFVHVAVAVIVNDLNQVLISKRPEHAHQGGLWEFPGGKIEADESVEQALVREINEELNIQIQHPRPLIKIEHHYSDKSVVLDVWLIKDFHGNPVGAEDQPIKWELISDLKAVDFPKANVAIINALQLPDLYMISGRFDSAEEFESILKKSLSQGDRIVQLRCKEIHDAEKYLQLAASAKIICEQYAAKLILNTSLDNFNQSLADGLHLNSQSLFIYKNRPIASDKWLSVSCHNEQEIKQAEKLKADIILLSPVNETTSHPGVKGIGWQKFSTMVRSCACPVYALGGMKISDREISRSAGAQGIAAISSLWLYEY